MKSESEGDSGRKQKLAMGILAMVLLTFAVYVPILPGNFLMDDVRLLGSDNPLINGQLTLSSLWFQTDFTLATFGWWVERLLFGNDPAGYHVVNIALHALSAVLLWRLLVRLKIPGAWVAGALFAVHPVCVNSVARVAELKNTLSMPFFLLSFIGYLRYETARLYPAEPDKEQRSSNSATLWYVISLVAFALALLAKTTVVMLPVAILMCAAWQRRRIAWKDILHTLPFFVLSLGFGLMSVWFQKNQALPTAESVLLPASFAERLAGAGYCFWFYLEKTLLPFHLSIIYPRWNIDAHTIAAYLPDLLLVAIFILCFQYRRSWGQHALFGLGSFVVLLFPALGFFDAQFLTMWQVSDHLQYTALAAILALVAAALAALPNKMIFQFVATVLLLGSSVLCFKRAEVFKTQESLMLETVAGNPAAWGAHNDLGVEFAKDGNVLRAMREFSLSLAYNPNNTDARENLAHVLTLQGKFPEAEAQFLAALKTQPTSASAQAAYANLLRREGRTSEALYHLRMAVLFKPDVETLMDLSALEYSRGHSNRAVAELKQALAIKPNPMKATVLNNLAWILATCPDGSVRNGTEAVQCAEEACALTSFRQSGMVGTLAAAYAEAGRFSEAISMAEKAVSLATDAGDMQFAAANQQLLLLYRAGKPYHENPVGHQGQ